MFARPHENDTRLIASVVLRVQTISAGSAGVDESRDLRARAFEGVGGPLGEFVDAAMDVRVVGRVIVDERVDDGLGLLRRRRRVEVDEPLARATSACARIGKSAMMRACFRLPSPSRSRRAFRVCARSRAAGGRATRPSGTTPAPARRSRARSSARPRRARCRGSGRRKSRRRRSSRRSRRGTP